MEALTPQGELLRMIERPKQARHIEARVNQRITLPGVSFLVYFLFTAENTFSYQTVRANWSLGPKEHWCAQFLSTRL